MTTDPQTQLAGILAAHVDHLTAALRANASTGLPDDELGMERAAELLELHKRNLLADERPAGVRLLLDAMSSALGDAAVPSAPAARPELRDRIADTVTPFLANFSDEETAKVNAREVADAVLAVIPAPADRVAVLAEAADAPAAECSAQNRNYESGPRLCIRAAQHRGDHIDERGFHWSDAVAVYSVADRGFRTGPSVRDRLHRRADEEQQPAGLAERIAAKRQEEPFAQLAEAWSSSGGLIDEEQQPETETRPRCPHCQLPHDLTPGSLPVAACQSIRHRIAVEDALREQPADEEQQPETQADEVTRLRAELAKAIEHRDHWHHELMCADARILELERRAAVAQPGKEA